MPHTKGNYSGAISFSSTLKTRIIYPYFSAMTHVQESSRDFVQMRRFQTGNRGI
jgi:hypothetical protein